MPLHAHRARQNRPHGAHPPIVAHLGRRRVQFFIYQFAGQQNLRADLLPAHRQKRGGAGLFVPRQIRLDKTCQRRDGRIFHDVIADCLRGDRDHVLAGRVAGGEFEDEVNVISLN